MSVQRLSVWPPLPLGVHSRLPVERVPFPLEHPNCRLFAFGRHAIFNGVRALGLGAGDEVLVPAYHHGSEVEAWIQAGLAPRFYDCDPRLEPDEAVLSALLSPRVRALHLTHFLGFPQDAARWREWCDENGLLLIEDAAQAWLSSRGGVPIGSLGDLAVFCLYKSVGVPEGAALISNRPPGKPPPDPRWGLSQVARRHGAWLAARSPMLNALMTPWQRQEERSLEQEVGLGDPATGFWRAVTWLVPRLCGPGVAAARRANYQSLLEDLGEWVPPPFESLPDGASPFAFPLDTDDKPALLRRLATHGVLGLNLWSVPHPSFPDAGFRDADRRRRRVVGLPVHQELRPVDLDRIVAAARPRPKQTPGLRLDRLAGFEIAGDRWDRLAEHADNVFATREWLSTWWRHFGEGELRLLGCRRPEGGLAAILPLHRVRVGPARVLRFLGHGPSDQLGPVCKPAERATVARAFRRALRERLLGDWDVLLGERLVADQGWSALLGGNVVRHESSPVVRAGSFEEWLDSRSANFRQQVGRRERKLQREQDLQYRLADDPGSLQDDLTQLFNLHAARWRGGGSTALGPERQAFHRDFARLASERGWLRLWLAEAGGRPIAALYGFRFAGSEMYYQSGRDPDWDRYAVGFTLLAHAIRAALDDGVPEYRLLRGDEPYKRRFANHDSVLETFVAARGAAATAGIAIASPLAERNPTRRWLRRAVG